MAEVQTATAAPTTTPAPSDAHERAPQDYLSDISGDLEAMDSGKPLPERGGDGKFKPADKPPEKPASKPDSKAPVKPAEPDDLEPTVAEKPDKTEKPPEKPAEVKPVKAADLRNAYENLKKRVREELEPEVQRLRSQIQAAEKQKPEESKPLVEKIEALEKRNSELEKQIEFVDFTQSKEFQTKYSEPYQQAWTDAVAEFRELTVREPDGDDDMGEPKFKRRPADENDLLKLANMRLSDMDAAATEMFGASASRAIGHIQNLKRLSAAQAKALENAKTKAGEWKTQATVEQQKRTEALAKTWHDVNKSLEERYPKAFHVEQDDPDDKSAHTKGFALADLMFSPSSLTPEQIETLPIGFRDTLKSGKPLSESQKVQLHALARLKMANHDRKVVALRKANERIAELEKSLAEFEKSSPPAGKAGESAAEASGKGWMETVSDELQALDRR